MKLWKNMFVINLFVQVVIGALHQIGGEPMKSINCLAWGMLLTLGMIYVEVAKQNKEKQ